MAGANSPATRPAAASSAAGARNDHGTRWTARGSTPGLSAKAPQRKRTVYATVSTDPQTTPARVIDSHQPPPRKASKIASLPTNPASGGTPAIESAARTATAHRAGAE